MIRRRPLSLVLLALGLSAVVGQLRAQSVNVGYCTDEVAAKGLGNANATATISCAAAFTATGLLEAYQPCQMSSVRVGLSATEGVTSFRVWVRPHLDADNLAEADVPVESLVVGWNQIELPASVLLAQHDTLYCGYDYTQDRKSVALISHNGQKKTPLSFWIASNGNWRDYTSNNGPLSIQAVITGQVTHACRLVDLWLDERSQPFRPDGVGYADVHVHGRMQNLGSAPLADGTQFGQYSDFGYSFLPGQGVEAPQFDVEHRYELQLPEADALVVDGQRTLYYDLYDSSRVALSGLHLVEEFTSERCGFAPLGQQRLRQAIALSQEADGRQYVVVSHHEGFGPADPWRLTSGSDYEATLFGPERLTFAPAALTDRQGLPFSTTLPVDTLCRLLSATTLPTVATLQLVPSVADGYIEVSVEVQPALLTFCPNPQLVVCLTQDAVPSVSPKNYYPDECPSDVQPDVVRAYLHNAEGSDALLQGADMEAVLRGQQPVTAYLPSGGEALTYRYRAALPSGIDASTPGLTLVAYICDRGASKQVFALGCQSL